MAPLSHLYAIDYGQSKTVEVKNWIRDPCHCFYILRYLHSGIYLRKILRCSRYMTHVLKQFLSRRNRISDPFLSIWRFAKKAPALLSFYIPNEVSQNYFSAGGFHKRGSTKNERIYFFQFRTYEHRNSPSPRPILFGFATLRLLPIRFSSKSKYVFILSMNKTFGNVHTQHTFQEFFPVPSLQWAGNDIYLTICIYSYRYF